MLSARHARFMFLAVFLAAPAGSFASSITLNGTCEAGTCPPVDTLLSGGSTSNTFNFMTSVNGDPFDVSGEYSASNPTSGLTTIQVAATALYEGSTPSNSDVLTLDDLQDYTVTGGLSGDYFEQTAASFGGPPAAGSSLSAELFYNGQGVGLLGPFTSAGSQAITKNLTLSGTALDADLQITFDFAAGSTNGSFMSTVPEPRGVAPVAAILAVVLGIAAMRRSRLSQKMV